MKDTTSWVTVRTEHNFELKEEDMEALEDEMIGPEDVPFLAVSGSVVWAEWYHSVPVTPAGLTQ